MANLGQIRSRALRSLQRVGISATEQGDVDDWINETIREDICLDFNWPFMWANQTIDCVQGTEEYTFTNNERVKDIQWMRTREAATDDWIIMQERTLRELHEDFTEQTEGDPRFFGLTGVGTFKVRAIPDSSDHDIQAYLSMYPAALSQDTDENYITQYYPKLLVLGVVSRGLLNHGELADRGLWEEDFQRRLAAVIRHERVKAGPQPATLRPGLHAGQTSSRRRGWGRYLRLGPGY